MISLFPSPLPTVLSDSLVVRRKSSTRIRRCQPDIACERLSAKFVELQLTVAAASHTSENSPEESLSPSLPLSLPFSLARAINEDFIRDNIAVVASASAR